VKHLLFLLLLLPFGVAALPKNKGPETTHSLYRAANTPTARQQLRAALNQQPDAFLNQGKFEVGYLLLRSGRRVLVPGLRYHLGQRVVEVQDSVQADSTSFWPLAALRGFDLGTAEDPATLRRYRTRLVHDGRQPDRQEAVQVLTATDAGPLLLAYLPLLAPATDGPTYQLLAGEGHEATQPLRTVAATEADVLRLLGERAGKVQAYARIQILHFCAPTEAARILDYYNQLAVAVR